MNTKHHIFLLCALLLCGANAYAAKKTFERDYTYRASDADSKNSARAIATNEMRSILLREVGELITASRRTDNGEYTEQIEAITAGIVEMKVLDERWDGKEYYIRASMTVDINDLVRRIEELRQDKKKTQELQDERRRRQKAEEDLAVAKREAERSKREAEQYKNDAERQKKYYESKREYQRLAEEESASLQNYRTTSSSSSSSYSAPKSSYSSSKSSYSSYSYIDDYLFVDYRFSTTSWAGVGVGWCRRLGCYVQIKLWYPDMEEYTYGYNDFDLEDKKYGRVVITGGIMLRTFSWLYLYGGAGYGIYKVGYYHKSRGYGDISDYYYLPNGEISGLEWEAGATLRIKWFTLSMGYSSIVGSELGDIQFGIGFAFDL
jgi:hypothetical protein